MKKLTFFLISLVVFASLAKAQVGNGLDATSRIVAIGDIHGDYQHFILLLKKIKIIDQSLRWIAGKTVLVQVGDQLDRGDGEKKIIDFLEELKIQATKSGGKVYPLIGNHETMNVDLDFRYVTQKGFADFSSFANSPTQPRDLNYLPKEQLGRAMAFRPGGIYAKIIAQNNVVLKIGKTLFVHGGILPSYAKKGIDSINSSVSNWMKGSGQKPSLVLDDNGPLWSRHYSSDELFDNETCQRADDVLQILGAQRMVVAHTVQPRINSICDGKIWRIDTGISNYYGGKLEALEIKNDGSLRVID